MGCLQIHGMKLGHHLFENIPLRGKHNPSLPIPNPIFIVFQNPHAQAVALSLQQAVEFQPSQTLTGFCLRVTLVGEKEIMARWRNKSKPLAFHTECHQIVLLLPALVQTSNHAIPFSGESISGMIIDDVPALLGAQGQDLSIPVWLYFGIDLNPCFENFVGVGARVKTQMER